MSPKLRSCLTYTVAAVGVLALAGWLLYHGARWSYYQGWWGRDNPVARYLWLCSAPPDFEQTLYPANVEILVPACENLERVWHRPTYFTSDKQYLRVDHDQERSGYWLEIATGQILSTRPANVQYITRYNLDENNQRITIWIDLDTREVMTTHPGGVTLEECGRDYDFWEGLFSADGRRIARLDGIYDATNGEKLLDYGLGYDKERSNSIHCFQPCLWLSDNQSVILKPCMLWGLELLIFSQYNEYLPGTNYPVPQPVLKFTLPEAYR